MKLNIQEDQSLGETEITIRCPYLSDRLKRLVEQIRQYSSCLTGYQENRQFQIPLESIYYLESTDGKTFLYPMEKPFFTRRKKSISAGKAWPLWNRSWLEVGLSESAKTVF